MASSIVSSLTGKVALITGASSGIGAASAVLFARLGAKLALTGRNESNLQKVGKDCSGVGEVPLLLVGELTSEEDVKRIIDDTVKRFGRLDILVNNAGIFELGSIETTSLEQYDRIMNVNFRTVFHLTMLAVPHLIKTQGSIVNVSSLAGTRSVSGALAYAISKSAMDQLTRCTALELAPKKIRVNSVNPGMVVTDIQRRLGLDEENYQKFMEYGKKAHPLGRLGEPEDVARAIAFLASDNASFITGEHVHIDGGAHAVCVN